MGRVRVLETEQVGGETVDRGCRSLPVAVAAESGRPQLVGQDE